MRTLILVSSVCFTYATFRPRVSGRIVTLHFAPTHRYSRMRLRTLDGGPVRLQPSLLTI